METTDRICSRSTRLVLHENTLFEACGRFGWRVHGYVLMSNHYHLTLETPEPNLSVGMQWLQGAFANRFNHFVKTSGHVFQGRYKAIVVEELKARGIAESEILDSPKGVDWKVEIALRLRAETTASNPWMAERLQMGHHSPITNLLRAMIPSEDY